MYDNLECTQQSEWDERTHEMRRPRRYRRPKPKHEAKPVKKPGGGHLVLAVQVCTCCAVLLAALILRLTGGSVYQEIRAWYLEHLNSSILLEQNWGEIDLQSWNLFSVSSAPSEPEPSSSDAP